MKEEGPDLNFWLAQQECRLSFFSFLHFRSVFGSAVLCLQNVADDDNDVEARSRGDDGQKRPQQQQQPPPAAATAPSEDGLEMEVEGEEEEEEAKESQPMIEKNGT